MDATEQAIDQTLRITLTGVEYALRFSGSGATHLASALWSVAATTNKTKGKARLETLLKSGKELKVFNVTEAELPTFAKEARRYGVLYAVIKGIDGSPDAQVDVMVKAEDAAKINRIVERLDYGRFDETAVVVESARELAAGRDEAGRGEANKGTDALIDEMLGGREATEGALPANPTQAQTEGPRPSEPSSKGSASRYRQAGKAADAPDAASANADAASGKAEQQKGKSRTRSGTGFNDGRERPSVKAQIDEKRSRRESRAESPDKPAKAKQTRHQAPAKGKRRGSKSKTEKGR
jgi:hypothetical protein